MQDLSLHILDIVENSIDAGATEIEIVINEDTKKNLLILKIKDNGKGIDKKVLSKVLDPFYTTKKHKRVGLGLSLLAQSAKESSGNFVIKSKKNKGTKIVAKFIYDHIDRKPLGNMCDTIMALIGTKGTEIDFTYEHRKNGREFVVDTKVIKKKLDGIRIMEPEVLSFLRKKIKKGLKKIRAVL